MQTKWPTGSDLSYAPIPFSPLPPFSDRPPVFNPPVLIVPEKKCENDCAFISCAPASSYTYVPTIPRVPIFHSRGGMPAPAPLLPPLSPPPLPPVAASADCIGPLHPVLTDGKHRFHVEGLIATGGYGRVALATVEGVATPSSKVAIKVYCKDKLITNRMLLETYDLERAIMLENTIEDCQWLVKLRGTFGDLWNRYLVMVRIYPRVTTSQRLIFVGVVVDLLYRIIIQTRFRASFSILQSHHCQDILCAIGSKSSCVSFSPFPSSNSDRSRMLMYTRTHSTLTDPRHVRALQPVHRPLRLEARKYPRLAQGPSRNC
jgi:hypothetical protein